MSKLPIPLRWNNRSRRVPAVRRRFFLAAIVALSFPSAALAQAGDTNPLSPGLPVSPAATPTVSTPTTVTPVTTATNGGSLSGGGIATISVGAIVLLAGISFFIWRDARRRAPIRHRAAHAVAGDGARSGSKQRTKPRKLSPAERRRRKRGRAR
jgi:hypothetical protein